MRRVALGLILASLVGACQSPLTTHMPEDAALELDPVWFEFEPPWTEDDLPTLPDTPDATPAPDTVQGVPDEIPPDPLALLAVLATGALAQAEAPKPLKGMALVIGQSKYKI